MPLNEVCCFTPAGILVYIHAVTAWICNKNCCMSKAWSLACVNQCSFWPLQWYFITFQPPCAARSVESTLKIQHWPCIRNCKCPSVSTGWPQGGRSCESSLAQGGCTSPAAPSAAVGQWDGHCRTPVAAPERWAGCAQREKRNVRGALHAPPWVD